MAYQIDPEVLARECQEVLDVPLDTGERFSALIGRLSRVYPDIIDNRQRRWIGSRAGGILGKLTFLHVSFTEYLLIFGCPSWDARLFRKIQLYGALQGHPGRPVHDL